ncbi:hypothetical protein Nepgr_015472 [Nepenthes gracilis]|uniref:Cytochrome P450 n=1 Tax=Nepenthes gracilis TaxID=150966 RepID=A0AAD3SNP4_NEPGR|nr:hypothetical protein Nepgr_015472 [Nepenthes gracilis]
MESYFVVYSAISVAIIYAITKHLLNRIRNLPPSPALSLPIVGHLYLFKKPLHRSLAKISDRYGPIVYLRFGSRAVILVSSPSAIEECLTKQNDVAFANRPRLLGGKYSGYNHTSLVWAPYGEHWRNQRRIASAEILSSHRLQLLSEVRADEVCALVRRLLKLSTESEDQVVEMKSAIFGVTMNNMMRMISGKRCYGGDEEDKEARRFQETVEQSSRMGGATNLGDFLPILRWLGVVGSEDKLKKLKEKKDEFVQGLIDEHRRMDKEGSLSDGKKAAMIDVLLSMQKQDPDYYTDEMIKSFLLSLFSAGTDTTVGTIEWALSLLLSHPNALNKAQCEIDERVGHDRLLEESDNLPYLRCIINESLRMYPVAPLAVPHESWSDCNVRGHFVPRGTMMLYNIWAVHNDPKIWESPRQFKPERFAGLEGNRVGFKFLPFGVGRRSCPGEGLATRLLGLTLGSLIQCFEWSSVCREALDMREGGGISLVKLEPLQAKCSPRPSMKNLLSQI